MGNVGRNGGECYTPRPLIRAVIQVVKPKIGDRIYDGACGCAGFLWQNFPIKTGETAFLYFLWVCNSSAIRVRNVSTRLFITTKNEVCLLAISTRILLKIAVER